MASNFQNIFKYKTLESCENYQDRDSDSYNDCIMMMDVGKVKKETYIPSISMAMILYTYDMNGLYLKEGYLYDNMLNMNKKYHNHNINTFYDIFTYEQKFENKNHKYHEYSYHNCKMLKDIGPLKKDSFQSQIAIGVQLFGFTNNDEIIYDEIIS
jgi:hypothetical protein